MLFSISIYTNTYNLLGDKMNIFKYLKSFLYIIAPLLILNIIITIFYYFNLINSNVNSYLKLLTMLISLFIGGIYIGSKATKKGWLEGIKIGAVIIVVLFIISYLAFDHGITLKTIIYYFLIMTSSMLGSMLGINKIKSSQ